jgi:2-alkyl-3-oxoalkanoate reductase
VIRPMARTTDVENERRVAVTGATGFIGRRVVRELRDRGWRVRALVRRPDPQMPNGIELISGALDDLPSLRTFVRDVAVVIHCAGVTRAARARDFFRVNALGTARLLAAVRQAPRPPRVVLISSLAARESGLSAYSASKRQAEELLTASGVEHCTIRPPAVYGPGDRATLPFFRLLTRPLAVLPGSSRSRFSLIFVDDLAACVATLIERLHFNGEVIEPDDGQPRGYRWADLTAIAGRSLGIRVRPLLVPQWLLYAPAVISQAVAASLGQPPAIALGKLRELYHDDWVCTAVAPGILEGWQARTRFSEGFAHTLRWYVQSGWMDASDNLSHSRCNSV